MMFYRPRRLTAIATIIGATVLGACSARTGPVVPAWQPAMTRAPMESGPLSIPYVAGTYVGTYKQTGGTGPQSGSITIRLRQYVSYLWGPIVLRYPSHRARITFSGILEERGKQVSFDMKLRWRGAHGRGDATFDGSKLYGKIVFPARGSVPKTTIVFTTKQR
jgi:hypothetical protein